MEELRAAIAPDPNEPRAEAALKLRTFMRAMPWVPERSDSEMVETVNFYLKAVDDLPVWAVIEAIDKIAKTAKRRPAPAELRDAAKAAIKPVEIEIAARNRKRDHQETERREMERRAQRAAEAANGGREHIQVLVDELMRLPDRFDARLYRSAQ